MALRSLVSLLFWNLVAVLLWGYLIFHEPRRLILCASLLAGQVLLNVLAIGVMKRLRISGITVLLVVVLFAMGAKVLSDDGFWEAGLLLVPFGLLMLSIRADRGRSSRKARTRPKKQSTWNID